MPIVCSESALRQGTEQDLYKEIEDGKDQFSTWPLC